MNRPPLRLARPGQLPAPITGGDTLAAQHDDAIAKHQDHRRQLFSSLLARVDQDAS